MNYYNKEREMTLNVSKNKALKYLTPDELKKFEKTNGPKGQTATTKEIIDFKFKVEGTPLKAIVVKENNSIFTNKAQSKNVKDQAKPTAHQESLLEKGYNGAKNMFKKLGKFFSGTGSKETPVTTSKSEEKPVKAKLIKTNKPAPTQINNDKPTSKPVKSSVKHTAPAPEEKPTEAVVNIEQPAENTKLVETTVEQTTPVEAEIKAKAIIRPTIPDQTMTEEEKFLEYINNLDAFGGCPVKVGDLKKYQDCVIECNQRGIAIPTCIKKYAEIDPASFIIETSS